MKITDNDLLTIETKLNILTVQSKFWGIVYAVDKPNNTMWLINRQTGAQVEIDGKNVCKLAEEMNSVAELYLGDGLRKGA
jgi:hypothetical protein